MNFKDNIDDSSVVRHILYQCNNRGNEWGEERKYMGTHVLSAQFFYKLRYKIYSCKKFQ